MDIVVGGSLKICCEFTRFVCSVCQTVIEAVAAADDVGSDELNAA